MLWRGKLKRASVGMDPPLQASEKKMQTNATCTRTYRASRPAGADLFMADVDQGAERQGPRLASF